ncbi:cupin domain-containing protein [Fluviibacterium sp. DFM31]|uniref:Cupin domain-containing protein n=1 Tax=Meridianimarinicoccus marinus TaxID=3231483 RepID=A0ABV3L5X8_9RHOB
MPKLDLNALPREQAPPHWNPMSWMTLGDPGGLSQFGVALETLEPGSRSSDPHWHESEDEFLFVLSGEVTLCEDTGDTLLHPGDAAAFPAGTPLGHCLVNRSGAPATYLIVGTRAAHDRVHYTTLDKIRTRANGIETLTRRDGTVLEPEL